MKTLLTWTVRLAVVALLAALVRRAIRSVAGGGPVGGGGSPVVAADTWPPVPTNPNRAT